MEGAKDKDTGTMGLVKLIVRCVNAMQEAFLPRYHPERHYMRGPGPACARRENGDNSAHA